MFDKKENKDIDYDVENYKRIPPYVYAKGEKGYTKLNYETAELAQSKDINDFSKEDQNILEGL